MAKTKLRHAVLLAATAVLPCAGPRVLLAQPTERILRIGRIDGPPEYTFGTIGGVAILPDGQLLVLDLSDRTLRVYNSDGEFVRSFGRQGNGPGEFQHPNPPILAGDTILVYDQQLRRLSAFGLDGTHHRTSSFDPGLPGRNTFRLLLPLGSSYWLGERNPDYVMDIRAIVGGTLHRDRFGMATLLYLNPAGADTILEYRTGATFWYDAQTARVVTPYARRIAEVGPEVLWAAAADSALVTVDAVRGRITWYSKQASRLARIHERDLNLQPMAFDSESQLEAFDRDQRARFPTVDRPAMVTPRFLTHFASVILDDRGRVWLRRNTANPDTDDSITYAVVGPEGPIHDIVLPPRFGLVSVERGMLLGVATDDLDVQYVELHRLRVPDLVR